MIYRSANLDGPEQEEFAVFPTLFILRSIRRFSGFQSLRQRAKAFVVETKQPGGVWSYWYRTPPFLVPPDVDVTALALSVIRDQMTQEQRAETVVRLARNRDDSGLFQTWYDSPENNDIDLVVNVNVVGALGEGAFTEAAIREVGTRLGRDASQASYYYPTKSSLTYALAWAVDEGVTAFKDLGVRLHSSFVSSWERVADNDLAQSLAAGVHLGMDVRDDWHFGLARLLSLQDEAGSWPCLTFSVGPRPPSPPEFWFASRETHTAVAMEAIHGCLPLLKQQKSLT